MRMSAHTNLFVPFKQRVSLPDEKFVNYLCKFKILNYLKWFTYYRQFYRLNKAISARSQSFFLYSEPIYRMSKYYRDEMESRSVCYSSADMVSNLLPLLLRCWRLLSEKHMPFHLTTSYLTQLKIYFANIFT